jgi:hypothetical protein
MTRTLSFGALLASVTWPSMAALATGGHHAVDDATILDPGRCHVETWIEMRRGSDYFANLGPTCNVGGLEWSLALERERTEGASAWGLAPQVKAAWPIGDSDWSVGAVLAFLRSNESRRWETTTAVVPVSLVTMSFELHFNLGYDWQRGAADDWRYGVSVVRKLVAPVEGIVELFNEARTWHGQLGMRWNSPREGLSMDLSIAQAESGSAERWVTFGVTQEFGR